MRIAFCTVPSHEDRGYWSGTPYFMARSFSRAHTDLVFIDALPIYAQPFQQKSLIYKGVLHENYLAELEPLMSRCLSIEVDRRLRNANVDVIVSPGCFPYPNIFLKSAVPVVFWADATVANLLEIYPDYENLCEENIWCGQELQTSMLSNCGQAIFASHWAAGSARDSYGTDQHRVEVVPFGANLHLTIENETHLERVLSSRTADWCNLVVVARNFQQRGGDFALSVARFVESSGIRTRLTVAGCEAVDGITDAAGISAIEFLPRITKDEGDDEKAYATVLAQAHFLLHPSRTTCFGIGMCEANSWAVPVLACRSGGAETVISDNRNGFLFAPDASPEVYGRKILDLMRVTDAYKQLCRSAWLEYKSRLNWDTAVEKVLEIIRLHRQLPEA